MHIDTMLEYVFKWVNLLQHIKNCQFMQALDWEIYLKNKCENNSKEFRLFVIYWSLLYTLRKKYYKYERIEQKYTQTGNGGWC